MLGRLRGLFGGGKKVLIQGTGKLPEGEARKVTIGDPIAGTGLNVILARVDGALHAVDARCPHEGGQIMPGPLVEGRYVRCPLHNYHFDPKSGACVNAGCGKARVLRAVEKSGDTELQL